MALVLRLLLALAVGFALAVPASGAVRALPPNDPCVAAPTCVLVVVDRSSYKSSSGDATITSSPPGINCRFVRGRPDGMSTCRTVFKSILPSLTVTLTATPDPGSVIRNGCTSVAPAPCTTAFTIAGLCANSDSCSAHYFRLDFVGLALAVTKSGEGTGAVTSEPAGIACGVTCTETGLAIDAPVTLTARPDAGAVFKAWTGACAGQKATCKLTITRDTSTNAVFGLPSPATTTTTKTTTVTTTSPPPPPSTPPPPPPPPPVAVNPSAQLVARLAGLRVLTHGKTRSLRVTVRIPAPARAQVQLLQQGFERARKLVRLHAGANTVRMKLPASLTPGSYRLRVDVRAGGNLATTTALVTLKTKGG